MEVEETPCKLCGGRGSIMIDDLHEQICKCAWLRMFKAHVGPDIAPVQYYKNSPLYVLSDKRGKPTSDLTKSNVFIKSSWRGLLSHLKWVLFYKGLNFRFKVITDDRILNVRLGKYMTNRKRDKEHSDDALAYDNLSDLLEGPDLVLIRLGTLGYKNVAAPGYLKEALVMREVACRPTWLLEEPSNPFIPGVSDGVPLHFSYNEDVASYIWDHFSVVDLTEGAPVEEPEEEPVGMNVTDVNGVVDETAENETAENDTDENEGSADLSIYDNQRTVKPKFKPKKHKKGSSR